MRKIQEKITPSSCLPDLRSLLDKVGLFNNPVVEWLLIVPLAVRVPILNSGNADPKGFLF